MKTIVLVLGIIFLSACGHTTVIKVPVIQPWPEPPVVSRPDLPIVANGSKGYDILNKDIQVTVQKLMDYASELENYLDVYRHQPAIDVTKIQNE